MKIETLLIDTFYNNNQDFSKCENDWHINDDFSEESLKKIIAITVKHVEYKNPKNASMYDWDNIVKALNDGKVILSMFFYIRLKNDLPKCPLCGGSYNKEKHEYAISRKDNITLICNYCGIKEALSNLPGNI